MQENKFHHFSQGASQIFVGILQLLCYSVLRNLALLLEILAQFIFQSFHPSLCFHP